MMGAPATRRGFLSGLLTLPLIGGGVTLIGQPSAVAEPVTLDLVERYCDWLAVEYGEALIERSVMREPEHKATAEYDRRRWCQENGTLCGSRGAQRFLMPPALPPSTRAALIMGTAGVDWQGGRL